MTVIGIIAVWLALSCVIGPGLTWLFWYGKRRSRFQ